MQEFITLNIPYLKDLEITFSYFRNFEIKTDLIKIAL